MKRKELSEAQLALVDKLKKDEESFSREREFMENLFIGRVNFFLLTFSLFVTGGLANNFTTFRSWVFYLGAIILSLFWLTIFRAYQKLDLILRVMLQKFDAHPSYILEKMLKEDGYNPRFRNVKLMGVYIPWFCIGVMLLAGLSIDLCLLK